MTAIPSTALSAAAQPLQQLSRPGISDKNALNSTPKHAVNLNFMNSKFISFDFMELVLLMEQKKNHEQSVPGLDNESFEEGWRNLKMSDLKLADLKMR